jgi:HNH endonuclease
MKSKPLPSVERLNELFTYQDGKLIAKPGQRVKAKSMQEAGNTNPRGYRRVCVDQVSYARHRLIWKMLKGYDPDIIDHINGIPGDDRIENLQNTTQRHNTQKSLNTTDRKIQLPLGVHPCKSKFRARIRINGRVTHIGTYDTPAEAAQAYQDKVLELAQRGHV